MSGYWSRESRRQRKLEDLGTALLVVGAIFVAVGIVVAMTYGFALMGDPRSAWMWGLR